MNGQHGYVICRTLLAVVRGTSSRHPPLCSLDDASRGLQAGYLQGIWLPCAFPSIPPGAWQVQMAGKAGCCSALWLRCLGTARSAGRPPMQAQLCSKEDINLLHCTCIKGSTETSFCCMQGYRHPPVFLTCCQGSSSPRHNTALLQCT